MLYNQSIKGASSNLNVYVVLELLGEFADLDVLTQCKDSYSVSSCIQEPLSALLYNFISVAVFFGFLN